MIEKSVENHNLAQDQQDMLNGDLEGVNMEEVLDNENGDDQTPTPAVMSNTLGTSQST